MRLTASQLRQIISEELSQVDEGPFGRPSPTSQLKSALEDAGVTGGAADRVASGLTLSVQMHDLDAVVNAATDAVKQNAGLSRSPQGLIAAVKRILGT